jgi:hypothetical protein
MLTHVDEIVARQRYEDLLSEAALARRAKRPRRNTLGRRLQRMIDRFRTLPRSLPSGRIEIGTEIN